MSKVISGVSRLPWKAINRGYGAAAGTWRIEAADDLTIAAMISDVPELTEREEANAQRIVLAVNNFKALVSALNEFVRLDEESTLQAADGSELVAALNDARALLLKCTPEKPKDNLPPPSSQSTGDE
jgi:hypothetical protein